MMKKKIAILLTAVMAFSAFAGYGSNGFLGFRRNCCDGISGDPYILGHRNGRTGQDHLILCGR